MIRIRPAAFASAAILGAILMMIGSPTFAQGPGQQGQQGRPGAQGRQGPGGPGQGRQQGQQQGRQSQGRQQGQQGQGRQGQRRPPLVMALDTNGDSVISSEEIAASYNALKAMDKNGDGKLTTDEFRGANAMGRQGGGGQRGGPQGLGGGQGQRGGPQGQGGAGQGRRSGPAGVIGGGGTSKTEEVAPRDQPDRPRDISFRNEIELGSTFTGIEVYDTNKNRVPLNSLLGERHTVIVSGCLTCPAFLNAYREVEAVHADYKDKVNFYFLYHVLAHPENRGYIQPMSIDERFMHIEEAKKTLGTTVPWIADTMENNLKAKYVFASNPEFIFAPGGKLIHREPWSRGTAIRAQLEKLVGKSAKTTTIEELGLPEIERVSEGERSGLVERVQVNGMASALKFTPAESDAAFYCKMRPEVDRQLLNNGTGQMYLGFHLDPIHDVKWNNLAEPLRYELTGPAGATFTPAQQQAKKMDVESDGDPREFIVDVQNWNPGDTLTLTVYYFACHKTENWCKPVTQRYTITLANNEAGGRVAGRSHKHGGGGRQGGGRAGGGQGDRANGGNSQGGRRGQQR